MSLRASATTGAMNELEGKTFVVTGANTGLGRATVEALASRGASRIVVVARSHQKTQPVLDDLAKRNPRAELAFVPLELGDLASCARAADEILRHDRPIDALVDNAGIAGLRGMTKDGFELTFGTNHLGPFVFTEKLLPLVERAPQGRIVVVSSVGHYRCKAIDWDAQRKPTASFSAMTEYSASKLCNVLYAKELARRLTSTRVTTYSLHPGTVGSDIWSRRLGIFASLIKPFMITSEEGARTQIRCATDPKLAMESGLYYDEEHPKEPNRLANDVALQDELIRRSREWAGAHL